MVGVDDFDAQCVQTFANIEAALKSVGAGWGNIVQFTTYLVHSQDIPKFMKYRLREFPKMFSNGVYPPNTLLMVDRLVQEALLVEVQASGSALITLRVSFWLFHQTDVADDNAPAFRKFHPGLRLAAGLAGSRWPLIERRGNGEIAAECGDDRAR